MKAKSFNFSFRQEGDMGCTLRLGIKTAQKEFEFDLFLKSETSTGAQKVKLLRATRDFIENKTTKEQYFKAINTIFPDKNPFPAGEGREGATL